MTPAETRRGSLVSRRQQPQLVEGGGDGLDVGDAEAEALGRLLQRGAARIGLDVGYQLREVGALVEGALLVAHQVAHHAVLLEYQLLYAEGFGHASQGDGADELVDTRRHRPEAVLQTAAVGGQLFFHIGDIGSCVAVDTNVVEFLVQQQSFAHRADVLVGYQHLEVGLDGAFAHVLLLLLGFGGEELAEVALLQLLDGFVEYLVVHVVAHLADES